MKSTIMLFLIGILIFTNSCKKEDPPEPSSNSTTTTTTTTTTQPPLPTTTTADYWGCWSEATGKPGVYDIILTEDIVGPHIFEFGTSCVPEPTIPAQATGVFRNDTLILDNGTFEYWCFIENDTLLYSAYIVNPPVTEKFVKI